MLEHVTFTGIDERTDLERVARIGRRHRWAEFGVLADSQSETGPRYPNLQVIEKLRELHKSSGTETAIHLCGRLARAVRAGKYETATALCGGFGRIQINLPSSERLLGIDHCAELGVRAGKRVIVQHEGPWPVPDTWQLHGIDRLHDRPEGTGTEAIEKWPEPPSGGDGHYGYAGGLGPHNIGRALEFAGRFSERRIWLDMETGVRDAGDWLDLDAVEGVCEQVAQWREETAENGADNRE